jgi:hypothetical protein
MKKSYFVSMWLAYEGASSKHAIGDYREEDINRDAKAWRRHTPRGDAFKRMLELQIKDEFQHLCTGCKERFDKEAMITAPVGRFHSFECQIAYAMAKSKKAIKAQKARQAKEAKADHRAKKEQVKGRLGYYSNLGTAINRYAKHVIYKGQPCYTCGKQQKPTDSPQSFHAGHYMPAKRVDPRRFMIDNIRIQCYSCNSANSGRGAEYRKRMIEEKGLEWVEWLECEANHQPLKDKFPEIKDIREELARIRKATREAIACDQ